METDPMADLAEVRRQTADLVADLEVELAAIAESTAASPDDEHDAEGSTVGYERARVGALLEAALHSLAGIDEAIARLESGHYGICTRCAALITPERLAALPSAELCVGCAGHSQGSAGFAIGAAWES